MGFAFGTLMKDRAEQLISRLWAYLEDQVEDAINGTSHFSWSHIVNAVRYCHLAPTRSVETNR